jgi:hypothetical protein
MNTAKFRVHLRCASNNLNGMVEVISLTSSGAKRLVKQTFFKGKGWEIVKVENLGKLPSWNE